LVRQSRHQIKKAKLDKLAKVYRQSFWRADFAKATVITVYLFPNLRDRLQKLLEKKVNHPIRLVANDYPFPQLIPSKHEGQIYLYHLGNNH
jgi:hypothetical protein